MTAIAIDDEPIALDIVKSHAEKVPFVELKAVFTNAFDALTYLQQNKTDLIFLDIKMPDISGMDFLNSLTNPPMVIFTTAYTEYAVESYLVNTVDYLLKPITFERFVQAIDKVAELITSGNKDVAAPVSGNFFIKSGKAMVKVNHHDIHYIEGLKDYVIFRLKDDQHIVYKKMKDLETLLPKQFVRVQQSFIINLDQVIKIEDNHAFLPGKKIPIGARFRDQFMSNVKARLI